MRIVVASACFVLAAVGTFGFIGCGGDDNAAGGGTGDGGATTDGSVKKDGGGTIKDGGAVQSCTDITGSKMITVSAEIYNPPTNTPNAGARCIIATADGSGCQNVKADANGLCTFNVDPAKGPFDVTVGNSDTNLTVQAISILGITDSVPGKVIQGNLSTKSAFSNVGITGNITNLAQGDKLQIDAWDFQTVVTNVQGGGSSDGGAEGGADGGADGGSMVSSFSSQYNYSPSVPTKIGLAVVEVDGNGNAVKGLLTPLQARSGQPMKVDIDMSTAVPPTTSTINIQWPTAGLMTGTTIKQVNPKVVQDMHIGNCIIEKNTPDEANAAMFVGVGNVTLPANGKSAMTLQIFPTIMKPDIAEALLTTLAPGATMAQPTDVAVIIQPHDLTDGATLQIPQVNAFDVAAPAGVMDAAAVSLDNVQIAADSVGYDVIHADIFDTGAGVALWTVYATGATLKARGLPLLPAGTALQDIGGPSIATGVAVSATKYASGTNRQPWESLGPDTLVDVGMPAIVTVPQGTLR